MTAQINDSVIFNGKQYSLAECDGENLFNPEEYGLKPTSNSTACWRGFVCTYTVHQKHLRLSGLSINISPEEFKRLFKALEIDLNPNADEHSLITHLSKLTVDVVFTGDMLIGREFINELYVHMGFHPAHKYREVWLLTFDKGRLTDARDVSEHMEEHRNAKGRADIYPDAPEDELRRWVEDTFSRRLRRKP